MTDTAKLPPPNPAAFPLFTPDGHFNGSVSHDGMALRDYFAAKALPSTILLVMESAPGCQPQEDGGFSRAVARLCYQMADAMLAERVVVRS